MELYRLPSNRRSERMDKDIYNQSTNDKIATHHFRWMVIADNVPDMTGKFRYLIAVNAYTNYLIMQGYKPSVWDMDKGDKYDERADS